MTVKIKLINSSGIDKVRFRGVHFDPGFQFTEDVPNNGKALLSNVPNGSIGLTAYRISDQQALDILVYPVSDTQGFAAHLLHDPSDPYEPYKLVGEPWIIE
jgi:hypothetical protein